MAASAVGVGLSGWLRGWPKVMLGVLASLAIATALTGCASSRPARSPDRGPAKASVHEGGITFSISLPGRAYAVGEEYAAKLTLSNDSTRAVQYWRGGPPGAGFDLKVFDPAGREVYDFFRARIVAPDGTILRGTQPPYPATLAPGRRYSAVLAFRLPSAGTFTVRGYIPMRFPWLPQQTPAIDVTAK